MGMESPSGCQRNPPEGAGNRHKTARGKIALAKDGDLGESRVVQTTSFPGFCRYARPASLAGFAVSGLSVLQIGCASRGRISPPTAKGAAKCGRSREDRHNPLISALSESHKANVRQAARAPDESRCPRTLSPGGRPGAADAPRQHVAAANRITERVNDFDTSGFDI